MRAGNPLWKRRLLHSANEERQGALWRVAKGPLSYSDGSRMPGLLKPEKAINQHISRQDELDPGARPGYPNGFGVTRPSTPLVHPVGLLPLLPLGPPGVEPARALRSHLWNTSIKQGCVHVSNGTRIRLEGVSSGQPRIVQLSRTCGIHQSMACLH